MKAKAKQGYGDDPLAVRDTGQYKEEYIHQFVEKWDELIDWEARAASEGSFFIDVLKERGAKKVLDVACGTGFHSVRLLEAGFEVVSADGSPDMLAKAFANGRKRGHILRTVQADWRWLNRDIHGKFDAVICLGNSFTHLFSEHDRRKALAEFYAVLRHDGVLILDQRNYDTMLSSGFKTKHSYYYCGENVVAYPEHIDPGLARFCYEFPDKSVFHLNMFPLKKDYVTRLVKEVGFQEDTTYGDFQETYHEDEPDFFVHVAEKSYLKPDPLLEAKAGYSLPVNTTRNYYNSTPADRFYATVWGGEDIHIGLYQTEVESISAASRRTVERLDACLPALGAQDHVLDLGAGYGGAARYLAEAHGCQVSCLNLSEIQNERNRRINEQQGLQKLVSVHDGNFEDIPFKDELFDVVWSQDSFLHSGDRQLVIREAVRVLKPGGLFIFTDPMQRPNAPEEALKPVLERILLESMGTVEFYQQAAREEGLETVDFIDLSENLPKHYDRVLKEIESREAEAVEASGQDYVDRMKTGLRHWIKAGHDGHLQWGILIFRKK
jgi:glycine/sarcosine/dimethylglycine N-methyltransferase